MSSSNGVRRENSLASIVAGLRAQRTFAVLLQDAFAEQLGLLTTDLVCGDLIYRHPGISPGELTRQTGLSSGAISGVVDRLEAGGYVRRRRDPVDGRRVRLKARQTRVGYVQQTYAALNAKLALLCETFSSAELQAIERFVDGTNSVMGAEAVELRVRARTTPASGARSTPHSAPRKKKGRST